MAINGLNFIIDNSGITLQGSMAGSTRPDITPLLDNLPDDTRLIVYSKPVYIPGQVNSITNPYLILPAVYGAGKSVLSVKGEIFLPGLDFISSGYNAIKWLSSTAINPTDEVSAWGPGNLYTANAITIELIDLLGENVFTPGPIPKVKLKGINGNINTLPYNQSSIYFCVDRKVFLPGIDFTYDELTSEISWLKQVDYPISNSSLVFAFYYNKTSTSPFLLGQILSRNIIELTEDNPDSFEITAPPKTSMNSGSNLFYDTLRYNYGSDYLIQYPSTFLQNGGQLKPVAVTGKYIDFSYFKDGSAYSPIIMVTQEVDAGTSEDGGNPSVYLTQYNQASQFSVTNKKTLVFFRGAFAFGSNYDNGAIGTLYPGTLPEYTRDNNFIRWDSDRVTPIIIPQNSDWFDIVSFNDAFSQSHLNVEYFKRTNSGPDTFTLQKAVKQNKVMMFYCGEALFPQFGDFSVNPSDKKIMESMPYTRPNSSRFDDIVFVYVSDDSYGNLLYFDYLTVQVNQPANTILTFSNPISNKNNTLLFIGPKRIRFEDYDLSVNPQQIILNIPIFNGDKIMLVHT